MRKGYAYYGCLGLLYIMFVIPFKIIRWIFRKIRDAYIDRKYRVDFSDYPDEDEWIDDDDNEEELSDELTKYSNLPDIPEMAQVIPLDDNTSIGIEFVSMCPDETAHIRIIGETSFSQLYKRRVYRERNKRYFKLNNAKYYIRENVQPITVQAKKGK